MSQLASQPTPWREVLACKIGILTSPLCIMVGRCGRRPMSSPFLVPLGSLDIDVH